VTRGLDDVNTSLRVFIMTFLAVALWQVLFPPYMIAFVHLSTTADRVTVLPKVRQPVVMIVPCSRRSTMA
jgi:hypothetical protein